MLEIIILIKRLEISQGKKRTERNKTKTEWKKLQIEFSMGVLFAGKLF